MKKLTFLLLFIILFSFSEKAFGATLYLSSARSVSTGEIFELLISIDTNDEIINSVELEIDYDETLLNFSGYRESDTGIKLWIESPREKDGRVYLSGIIPGGASGVYDEETKNYKNIPLTKLLFLPVDSGQVEFFVTSSEVLKHDGKGTRLSTDTSSFKIDILGEAKGISDTRDLTPPLPFSVDFIKKIEDTPSVIVFNAIDIGSGIQKYEVKIGNRDWQESLSPMEVTRGIFGKKVKVMAYDFAGNSTLGEGRIPGIIPTFLFIIFLILISGFIAFRMVKYKL